MAVKIEKKIWHTTPAGEEILLYTLTNHSGSSVSLCNIGAGIVSIIVPDRKGLWADVVLGYESAAAYFGDSPCMGKVPGRFANRIANGQFQINGKSYQLPLNTGNAKHHLHGGDNGFQNHVWGSTIKDDNVFFTHHSHDGDSGYPGTLETTVRYSWNDENELLLEFSATTDTPTIINLTNHVYFNLNGEGNGNILRHKLKLLANHYLPATDELITTGEIATVERTPMDFTTEKEIGRDIHEPFNALIHGKGYDSCWAIDNYEKGILNKAATLRGDISGRLLEIFTTQPGIQIYTGNWLNGCPKGKNHHIYHDYDGVALECQAFPNAPNHANFPTTVLHPGQQYNEKILYKFSNK